jgi:cell division septation protein DedD
MKKGGGGGGETVLESRHVVGMFLGVVVLCGVFFTLGYVMGRTQQDAAVRSVSAASVERGPAAAKAAEKPAATVPTSSNWDFMNSTQAKKSPAAGPAAGGAPAVITSTPIKPESAPAKTVAAAPTPVKPTPAAKPQNALTKAPGVPRGHVVLQVAALTREGDALAMAEALQKKGFPAYLLTPPTGNLYRVQVGPYAEGRAAEAAKKALEREGFKAITKR